MFANIVYTRMRFNARCEQLSSGDVNLQTANFPLSMHRPVPDFLLLLHPSAGWSP